MHQRYTAVNFKSKHQITLTFHKLFSTLLCSDRGNQTRYPFWTKAQPEPDWLTVIHRFPVYTASHTPVSLTTWHAFSGGIL